MTRTVFVIIGLLAVGFVVVQPLPGASAQDDWTALFDGRNLGNFNPIGNANWEVADGAVQADSGSGFLVTKESYADFELTLEFWVDEPANSGIFIRCADPQSVQDTNAYEVNIYDTRADQTYRGLVRMAPKATGSRNYTQCDSLLIGDKCGAHTVPYIESKNKSSIVEHEATTSKIGEDQLFYLRQRGLDEETAVALVVNGFCREVLQQLPMEFAVEAQKLVGISLEGSVG